MVITLYEIGKILEEKSINKSRKSIKDLMNIKPDYANIKDGNVIKQVAPEEVNIGETILIKEGERSPLDGIVIKSLQPRVSTVPWICWTVPDWYGNNCAELLLKPIDNKHNVAKTFFITAPFLLYY